MATLKCHVILDWDGTLSQQDTLRFLKDVCVTAQQRHRGPTETESAVRDGVREQWDGIVKAYGEDYAAHESTYVPKKEDRSSVEDEAAWLASLVEVERRSVERAEETRIFRGVSKDDVDSVARQAIESGALLLREGWKTLFESTECKITIISVNWSECFIRACLDQAVRSEELGVGGSHILDLVRRMGIHANEIEPLGTGEESTGALNKKGQNGIRTSRDKLDVLRAIMRNRSEDTALAEPVIYVGDSNTDLECLLEADYGVCVRNDPMTSSQESLYETFRRVGIAVNDLSWLTGRTTVGQTVWYAKSFEEIATAIRRI